MIGKLRCFFGFHKAKNFGRTECARCGHGFFKSIYD